MIIESYFFALEAIDSYGLVPAILLMSLLSTLPVSFLTLLVSFVVRKTKINSWLIQFVSVQLFSFLFFLGESIFYSTPVSLFMFFEPAVWIFFVFVLPLTLVYRKIMDTYKMLPWQLVQFVVCFVGSFFFWVALYYVFNIFA